MLSLSQIIVKCVFSAFFVRKQYFRKSLKICHQTFFKFSRLFLRLPLHKNAFAIIASVIRDPITYYGYRIGQPGRNHTIIFLFSIRCRIVNIDWHRSAKNYRWEAWLMFTMQAFFHHQLFFSINNERYWRIHLRNRKRTSKTNLTFLFSRDFRTLSFLVFIIKKEPHPKAAYFMNFPIHITGCYKLANNLYS